VILAFGSAKTGPVTTSIVALAAAWPAARTPVIVELDPAGGDLAVRFGLRGEPGVVSLAAAMRRGPASIDLHDHMQALPGGIPVVVAPPAAEQVGAALRALADGLAGVLLADPGLDVLVDCGRLAPSRTLEPVLRSATEVVVVARPRAEEVAHLRARLAVLSEAGSNLSLLLVGDRPYGADEVAVVLGVPVLGTLAHDPEGAGGLAGSPVTPRRLRSSALLASARPVAHRLASLAPPPVGSDTDGAHARSGGDDGSPVAPSRMPAHTTGQRTRLRV
jgi:MinD-like ATPase involved in chromosome partitioning or flagellar assembly